MTALKTFRPRHDPRCLPADFSTFSGLVRRRALARCAGVRAAKIARKPAVPAGNGHPVVIFPRLGADGTTVGPLRDYCEALGYSGMDWGRGFNTGPQGHIDNWLVELADHVAGLLAAIPSGRR